MPRRSPGTHEKSAKTRPPASAARTPTVRSLSKPPAPAHPSPDDRSPEASGHASSRDRTRPASPPKRRHASPSPTGAPTPAGGVRSSGQRDRGELEGRSPSNEKGQRDRGEFEGRSPSNEKEPDIRSAILAAAVASIDEAGLAGVSMREVARRAGVSHQLPYHYFVDREGILAAIAETGYDALGVRLRAVLDAKMTGAERIAAAGRAYVNFACEHPSHFRVMFRADFIDIDAHPVTKGRADSCFSVLPEVVAAIIRDGVPPEPNEQALLILGWSMAHGLACLLLDGPLAKKVPSAVAAREATIDQVMEAAKRVFERGSVPAAASKSR